jgi:3-methyl-2-oxobutanoate hydroxymethyltransferase
MSTAYDAPTAELLASQGIDFILVGDSLGMVLLGYSSTTEVTMDEMIHHAKAARRGAQKSFLIGDLPLKGVERGPRQALQSAKRFVKEAHCNAVKLEWGPNTLKIIDQLTGSGIPVLAHIGLTPQSLGSPKNFKVKGQSAKEAAALWEKARVLQDRGAFALLLECVPWAVAREITHALRIPTFGIGAGPYCDGQVLVFQDLVGLFNKFIPRYVKRYLDADRLMRRAVGQYISEVRGSRFPLKKHGFGIKSEELEKFLTIMRQSKREQR